MIGSDNVYISVKINKEDTPVSVLSSSILSASGNAATFKFSSFRDGFINKNNFIAQTTDDDGEVWELV